MRVAEDGKELARFEYHNNNQLAKVIRENGIETFKWDGLALIERSGTKYINEPHVGGGNPILAIGGDGQKTEAIFTDMLGTSLGKVAENGYSAIDKTSFGADSSDKSSFFTGRPYVEDLGYAFLFRNYRADMGKWLSQDLIGYPDGWNNFAYCNNDITICIDVFGTLQTDVFPTMDAAAIDWGKMYNEASYTSNLEFGSCIYKVEGGYQYSLPNIGTENGVKIPSNPAGTELVGDIHSHGGHDTNYDTYNWGDKDKTGSGIKYLVTPDGKLQKYDPKTGKTTVISTNLPRDPKAPSPNPTGE